VRILGFLGNWYQVTERCGLKFWGIVGITACRCQYSPTQCLKVSLGCLARFCLSVIDEFNVATVQIMEELTVQVLPNSPFI
jgi:hypothetical protein